MTTHTSLTIQPLGGLANRMGCIASGVLLSRQLGCRLQMVWQANDDVGAGFSDLFLPIDALTELRPGLFDRLTLYSVPRRRNLFIPLVRQRLSYGFRLIDSPSAYPWLEDSPAVLEAARQSFAAGRNVYVASGYMWYDFDFSLLREIFVPVDRLQRQIDAVSSTFAGSPVVGMHIRRTDHRLSIASSPTHLFMDKARELLSLEPSTRIYLATDDENVKLQFLNEFGSNKIITSPRPASRTDLDGISDAVVTMYALSRTREIYASKGTTFSLTSSRLGGIPFTTLALHPQTTP